MERQTRPRPRGRVMVVGGKEASLQLLEMLAGWGYACDAADGPASLAAVATRLRPEAVLLATPATAGVVLGHIRAHETLGQLPVLADLTGQGTVVAGGLSVDDWVHSHDELSTRLEAALRAKRLVDREQRTRSRMETLLEIAKAATSSLELTQILDVAVDKIGTVIAADRCSVVLVEGEGPRVARVVASRAVPNFAPLQLDLARYPELRRALETRQPVCVEDAAHDPLMEEVRRHIVPLGVRSVLVQPILCQDDLLGAIFLRMSRTEGAFDREDQDFAQTVAAALANSIRNARLHGALRRKREDLESAYVDRYRELTDANRRLRELNRLKDDLLAMCSHDLRAPLQVLLGHGRLLLDGDLLPQQRASADAVLRMGRKILDLVESLLERGRGEGAPLTLEARWVDVAELCKDTTLELEILAAERGVALRAETPESLMAVADEVKLRQVLQNLITNAIHHAKNAGEVVVRAQRLKRPDGEAARVVVQDDGSGIPDEQRHTVFDKYRTGGEGTGLGLAICKEFVELHGGEIWVDGAPAGGSAFTFTVPLARTADPGKALAMAVQARAGEPLVLVVEDEPEVATVVEEVLRSRYRVEVARDGAEGVAKARALLPDLVVMDVFLPKLDGLDAAVALKASSDTAEIPLILLSAHHGVSEKVKALNLGAVDYLGKPFQPLELLARVERALKLRDTEAELHRSQLMLRRTGSDPHTGLFDWQGIAQRLDQEVSRSRRYTRPLAVAVLCPDRPPADLRRAAGLVRRRLRTPDILGHLGDGALCLLAPESTSDAVRHLLGRLLTELEADAGSIYRSAVAEPPAGDFQAEAFLKALLERTRGQ